MSAEATGALDEELNDHGADVGVPPPSPDAPSGVASQSAETPDSSCDSPSLCPVPNVTWNAAAIPEPNIIAMPHGPASNANVRNLFDVEFPSCHDGKTLLGNRYVCRGCGMLIIGPTGIGKSACIMQCAVSWSGGRPAFGIVPAAPLKILIIQAENDDGDLAEMREGVVAGLNLTPEEIEAARANIRVITEDRLTGVAFIQMLARVLAAEKPDLVIIDPAFAYVGGSVNDQLAVTTFLRSGLTPLLRQHDCGALVVHHSNKPATGKEKQGWQAGDFAYAGGGSSEWANWARAVVVIRSIGRNDVFELRLAKRGGRIGWKEADGVTPRYTTLIGHSKVAGQIFWRELTDEEVEQEGVVNQDVPTNEDDLLSLVPAAGEVAKDALVNGAKAKGIGQNRAKQFIKALVAQGQLVEVRHPRPGKKPAVHLARFVVGGAET